MPVASCRRRAIKYLRHVVQECLDRKPGDDRPDTMIQWLADAAPSIERKVDLLVERVMALNVASIHTTTMVHPISPRWSASLTDLNSHSSCQTLTGALHNLAAEPDKYLPQLREEVDQQCANGQPTKETLAYMRKIDGFLKEAGRFNNAGLSKFAPAVYRPISQLLTQYRPI